MAKHFVFLANISDHERLIPAIEGISTLPGVQSWHAVDGHVNLIVEIEGDTVSMLEHLTAAAGHVPVTLCEVLAENGGIAPLSSDFCHAWVFLDVEGAKVDAVRRQLTESKAVLKTLVARGGCDLIALVEGASFSAIDRLITEDIRPLDGILRLKYNRIINLTTL
jgi:DNA-binding Lrp family transcriptional regulator